MIDSLSIIYYAFPMRMLTSHPADEIFLPKYGNYSTNFKGLPFNMDIGLFC